MSSESTNETDLALWKAIRLNEFSPPKEPASEAVRQNIRSIWQRLWNSHADEQPEAEEVPELTSAPRSLLDELVPTPDRVPGIDEALTERLEKHRAGEGREGAFFTLVVPPHHDLGPFLHRWTSTHDNVVLASPPTYQDILDRPEEWLAQNVPQDAEYLVVPDLQRYYLRHVQGLGLIRSWIDMMWKRGQRGVIVCDSWAWSFLSHVCAIGLLQASPLTPAPFDADMLEQWIRDQVEHTYDTPVTFRRADNGKIAVRLDINDDEVYSDEYLVHLAAYTRGNPQVAWSIWRDSLSIASSHENEDDVELSAQAEAANDRGHTVWVQAWERVPLTLFPGKHDNVRLFLLHALLLHGGLKLDALHVVLTIPDADLNQYLVSLQRASIIELHDERWRVTVGAYPAVRELLRQEGFLVDSL